MTSLHVNEQNNMLSKEYVDAMLKVC